jgi:hypothetical protein
MYIMMSCNFRLTRSYRRLWRSRCLNWNLDSDALGEDIAVADGTPRSVEMIHGAKEGGWEECELESFIRRFNIKHGPTAVLGLGEITIGSWET